MKQKLTCASCGYYRNGRCSCYFAFNSMTPVQPTDSCDKHATPIEVDVSSVCSTSADCAKTIISRLNIDSVRACLERENRSTVRKMLESRLRKLERGQS